MAVVENVKKWLTALRSGEFTQGKDALRKGDSFSCLGVACELYRRETGWGVWNTYDDAFVLGKEHNTANLPWAVADWLGVAVDPLVRGEGFRYVSMVIDNGTSFERIADLLEEEYLPS